MRVVVTGSRGDWNYNPLFEELEDLLDLGLSYIAHGACKNSADMAADEWARSYGGVEVEQYPADWDSFGSQAGFIRNSQMLEAELPDLVVAYWNGKSNGTLHCIKEAIGLGIRVTIIPCQPTEESPHKSSLN